ncbi:hypothetical protein DSECCO2_274010 [anaerobic digester metagenome]
MQQSDPIFGSAPGTQQIGGFFLALAATRRRTSVTPSVAWRARRKITPLGFLFAVGIMALYAAFLFAMVPHANALWRTSGLISVLFGCTIDGERGPVK